MIKDLRTEYDDLQVYLDYKSGIDSVEFLSELHEIPISAVLMILNAYNEDYLNSETQIQPTRHITYKNPRPITKPIVGRSRFRCTSCGIDLPNDKSLWGVVWSDETQGMCKECVEYLRQGEESDDVEEIDYTREIPIERGRRVKLTLENEAEIVRRYEAKDIKVKDLAKEFSINSRRLYGILDKYGVIPSRNTYLSDEREVELISRYQNDTNSSVRSLAEEFSVSLPTVFNVLERHGVETNRPSGRKIGKSIKLSKRREANLVRAYKEYPNITALAKKYSIDRGTVYRILDRYGVDLQRTNPFPKTQRKEVEYGSQTSSISIAFDFSNQSADGEDLSGLDLRHVNFKNASLVGVDFTESDLRGVNLQGADIRNANFTDVDLRGANLMGAKIDGVIFENTDLSDANLALIDNIVKRVHKIDSCIIGNTTITDKSFIETIKFIQENGDSWVPDEYQHIQNLKLVGEIKSDLVNENLDGERFFKLDLRHIEIISSCLVGTSFIECKMMGVDFSSSNLFRTNFKGSDLSGANFNVGGRLDTVDFENCNLSGAKLKDNTNFRSCNWNNTNIEGTHFTNKEFILFILELRKTKSIHGTPKFRFAKLQDADLQGADLSGADLIGAYLLFAELQGANLQGANLSYADLQFAKLQGANLQGTNLEGANLERANLERANLQGATYDHYTLGLTSEQKSVMVYNDEDDYGSY